MRLSRGPMPAVVAVCVAAGLVACTPDNPEPTPTASPTRTAAPTPSPTPTTAPEAIAPERPAAMDEITVAGAEAAAAYFLELYPYVYATGDLTELRALSHPECVFCASVIGNVEEQVSAGHRSVGGTVSVTAVQGAQVSDTYFTAQVTFRQEASRTVDASGAVVEEFPEAKTYAGEVGLTVDGGRFIIRGAAPEEVEGA